jgi:DNA polymerase-3 subunit delta'
MVRFRPLRGETIETILMREAGIRDEPARLIAALSDGSLGRALAMSGETSIIETRDRALELLEIGPDPGGIQEKVRQWSRDLDQITARRTVEILMMWCHDLLGTKLGLPEGTIANRDRLDQLRRRSSTVEIRQIRQWIEALEEMVDSMARNVHPASCLHEALTRIGSTKISAP